MTYPIYLLIHALALEIRCRIKVVKAYNFVSMGGESRLNFLRNCVAYMYAFSLLLLLFLSDRYIIIMHSRDTEQEICAIN